MFLGSTVRPVRGSDNLTAMYEPIVFFTSLLLLFVFIQPETTIAAGIYVEG
jgi:hypothetical protein